MRGFDVDDGIEGFLGEGQVFRVALDEIEARNVMALFAERDAGGIEVEPGLFRGFECAGELGRAATVAATHFEHVLSADVG